ncbi:hypothetical protein K227x_60860 [Rubripirellula lacrimiformis]|uniref:Uncharacterized protein n=1 Tax=Rubripirellula lacrimiformis TaxID=1930273 RepID=A0A517NKJ1_9BACT|nr:hypothetical protein [Rubripirellula lacrimiformis]QDT07658.1 hypothetical protein K227x_60860 [Rubripirellula lacrimiformis]
MHLLTCPSCELSIPVANSQAGERITCSGCQRPIDVPTLGKLRQLPEADQPGADAGPPAGETGNGSVGFAILGLIATGALLMAGFCGIRWALIEVPLTTEVHIEEFGKAYQGLDPAQLIREYEQMEEYGIDLGPRYKYKQIEDDKTRWGRSGLAAASVGLLAVLGAVAIGVSGRKRK